MMQRYYDLISGARRGVGATLSRLVLSAGSVPYRVIVGVRNLAFDRGLARTARAPIPVISLGNLTTGGTGKTPLAAFIARWFRQHGVRVCFLSRGFGAGEAGTNDEALVLDQLCPDVPHLQNADRVAAARVAVEELESQLLILDDGFQHRRLARDFNIVLIDATNPWGFGHLLPRGLLREPVSSLRRAGLVMITRVDQVPREAVAEIRRVVERANPRCAIAEVIFPPVRLINSSAAARDLEMLRGARVAGFCGIGNPQVFRTGLERLGASVTAFRAFPDHYPYSRSDIDELSRWSAGEGAETVVTTQKDLVKIGLDSLGGRPLWAVEIGTQVLAGSEQIEEQLAAVLGKVTRTQ
jgi:tetraacyldisaccharide 4'-kinase